MGVKWSPEEDRTLITCLLEGKTAREIAAILNRPRNAVIGRSNRLKPPELRPQTPRKAYVKPKKREITYTGEVTGLAKSLLELRHNQCRWPLEGVFCSSVRQEGKPYCAEHHQIANVPIRGR